jgi:hypothetical protein
MKVTCEIVLHIEVIVHAGQEHYSERVSVTGGICHLASGSALRVG